MLVNLDTYAGIILAITVMASGGLAARITYFLGMRWNRQRVCINWMMIASALCAMATAYHISIAMMLAGGWFYGLFSILVCPLLVAASWLYLIGGIRIVERILQGLENKLTA